MPLAPMCACDFDHMTLTLVSHLFYYLFSFERTMGCMLTTQFTWYYYYKYERFFKFCGKLREMPSFSRFCFSICSVVDVLTSVLFLHLSLIFFYHITHGALDALKARAIRIEIEMRSRTTSMASSAKKKWTMNWIWWLIRKCVRGAICAQCNSISERIVKLSYD